MEKLLARFGVRAYAVRSGKHKGGGPVLVGDARADQEALAKLQEDLVRWCLCFVCVFGVLGAC